MTPATVVEAILQAYPEWPIEAIEYLDEGDFCRAYLINGEWVFRFAKHDLACESLRRECCLLPRLADQLTLKIPRPQVAALQSNAKLPFMAHRFLPGPALSQSHYLGLDDTTRTRCAEQVATFLNELHATDLELANCCDVPVQNYVEQYADLLSRARQTLYPALEEPERHFIEREIGRYLESGDANDFRPALLHGDLSPDHVLFDEASSSVSAIIDFGDMMIGDPAWDLVFIYEDYGLDFFARLLQVYGNSDRAALLRRVYQFYILAAIDWAVRSRLEGDAEFPEAKEQLQEMRLHTEEQRRDLFAFCGII